MQYGAKTLSLPLIIQLPQHMDDISYSTPYNVHNVKHQEDKSICWWNSYLFELKRPKENYIYSHLMLGSFPGDDMDSNDPRDLWSVVIAGLDI